MYWLERIVAIYRALSVIWYLHGVIGGSANHYPPPSGHPQSITSNLSHSSFAFHLPPYLPLHTIICDFSDSQMTRSASSRRPARTRSSPNGIMLIHRLRRWPSIKPALGQRNMFAAILVLNRTGQCQVRSLCFSRAFAEVFWIRSMTPSKHKTCHQGSA